MQMRLLTEHLKNLRTKLLAHHANIGKHPDVLGQAREGLIRFLLKDNLPTIVDFFTGEIIDTDDERSGQVDIIVQSAFSPKLNVFENINVTMNDTVLGAIEVKSNLTTGSWDKSSHLKLALNNVNRIKKLKRQNLISGYKPEVKSTSITFNETPCFLFAYKGPDVNTLIDKLNDYGKVHNLQQNEYWPEVITVLDKGYYLIKNDDWLIKPFDKKYNCSSNTNPDECLTGIYVYLCQIIESWNNQTKMTPFNKYFGIK